MTDIPFRNRSIEAVTPRPDGGVGIYCDCGTITELDSAVIGPLEDAIVCDCGSVHWYAIGVPESGQS